MIQQLISTMASVRMEEYFPPGFRPWSVERDQLNHEDPADGTHENSSPFQPLVVCLRVLGVQLDPSTLNESSVRCYRYANLSIGLFSLLLNVFCNCYIAFFGKNRDTDDFNKAVHATLNQSLMNGDNSTKAISSVMSWSIVIDYVNSGALAVGVHVSLFILSRQQKWKLLWGNVQEILQNHNEFKDLKMTIRRVTIAGLLIIFSESLVLMSLPLHFVEYNETYQIMEALLRLLVNFLHVYSFAGLLLFVVIGWTAALGFRSLGQELLNSSLLNTVSHKTTGEEEQLTELMIKWKSLHVLLCDTVDGINDCFGPILLIWVTHIFIGFISTPFYIVGGFHSLTATDSVILAISIFLIVTLTFHLFVITGVSSRIWHEAIKNGIILQQVNLKDSYSLQEQVDMLTTEVFLSLPRITAMEYGDLDLSLIPTLIGTTLTYLIILCQFQSSE